MPNPLPLFTEPTETQWSMQQQAILAEFSGVHGLRNVRVVARAGTGKTTVIIEGVCRAPEKVIVVCAFNVDIAKVLTKRLKDKGSLNAKSMTLHSMGYRCVMEFWEGIRVADPKWTRADNLTEKVTGKAVPDVIKRLVTKLHNLGREQAPHAQEPEELRDLAYRHQCEPDGMWAPRGFNTDYVLRKAYEAMELATDKKIAQETGIDYSDMIYLPLRLNMLLPTYDLVVVDEKQDMTPAQLEIAVGMCKGRVILVGDDRQCIYGWRGADNEFLANLENKLNVVTYPMTITFRCGQDIVALAAEIVPDFQAGPNNPRGEVRDMYFNEMLADVKYGDFILSRLNKPLVSTSIALLRRGIRARVKGKNIGKGLIAMVKKLAKGAAGRDMEEFLFALKNWEDAEVLKWRAAERPDRIEQAQDQAGMIRELCDNAYSVEEVVVRIEELFVESEEGVVLCSSVHRAKGSEANRVFALADTFRSGSLEERNIEYVAITRAKKSYTRVWPNAEAA